MLAACQQGPKQGQPGGEAPVVVSVWYSLEGKQEQALLAQFEQINKKREVLVKGIKIPAKDFVRKVWALQAGGQGPEIFIAEGDILAALYEQGAISPVLADSSQVYPSLLAGFTYNRQVFALPWLTDVPLLYYRKDIVSAPPVDLNELGLRQSIAVSSQDFLLFSPWWKAEGGILCQGKLPALNVKANEDFLLKLQTLKTDGKIREDKQAVALFKSGEATYLLAWTSDSINLNQGQGNWGCVSFSRLFGSQANALLAKTIGIANSSIKTSPALEDAIRLVEEELLQTEVEAAAHKTTGYMPANVNFYYQAEDGTLIKEAALTIENSWSLEGNALEWKLAPIFRQAWQNIADRTEISKQLATAQEDALKIGK